MESCHYCQLAKDYFNEKGISFTEYDVMADPDKRREAQEKSGGQMGVPVIVIGEEVMVGFDPEKIDAILAN